MKISEVAAQLDEYKRLGDLIESISKIISNLSKVPVEKDVQTSGVFIDRFSMYPTININLPLCDYITIGSNVTELIKPDLIEMLKYHMGVLQRKQEALSLPC